MKNRLFALLLAGIMLALPSCSKENPDNPDGKNGSETIEGVETPQVLTHIFRGETLTLPEDHSLRDNILPTYDKESGNLTVLLSHYEEILDEEGNYVDSIGHYYRMTFAPDGSEVSKEELEMGENGVPQHMAVVGDTTYYLQSDFNPETFEETYILHAKTGAESKTLENIGGFFTSDSRRGIYVNGFAVDENGVIYISSDQEVVVFKPDLTFDFTVTCDNYISNMKMAPDGKVYLTSYLSNGYGYMAIDKEKKSLSEPVFLGQNVQNIYFGEGYDMYYTTNEGLYGYTFAAEEAQNTATDSTATEEANPSTLVMSFQNSDVTGDSFEIYTIVDSEILVVNARDPITYENSLAVYKKAPDMDLSAITVIDLAIYGSMDQVHTANLVNFNKQSTDSRVIVTDYSKYNTDENYLAGSEKLARDIIGGLYQPDIIVGSSSSAPIQQLRDRNLFTDLYQFIDKDDRLNRDTILSSVLYSFENAEGKLWGLPSEFTVRTLVAPTAFVGNRTSWTFAEFMDFAKKLPEGVSLMDDLTQANASSNLLGASGYAAFVDQAAGTCSFDSPEFIQYLEFIKTLPEAVDQNTDRNTRYLPRHNGQIALDSIYIREAMSWVSLRASFNTDDIVLIGYPAAEGEKGAEIIFTSGYMMTSYCDAPEKAWEFIKAMVSPDYENVRGAFWHMNGFPILRSACELLLEEETQNEYDIYFSGGASWGSYDPEHPDTSELREPGYRAYFKEEDMQKMLDYLDNGIGQRASTQVPEDIIAIVNEEISTYLGGVKDAAGCANVIQSRVKLWLAEHE